MSSLTLPLPAPHAPLQERARPVDGGTGFGIEPLIEPAVHPQGIDAGQSTRRGYAQGPLDASKSGPIVALQPSAGKFLDHGRVPDRVDPPPVQGLVVGQAFPPVEGLFDPRPGPSIAEDLQHHVRIADPEPRSVDPEAGLSAAHPPPVCRQGQHRSASEGVPVQERAHRSGVEEERGEGPVKGLHQVSHRSPIGPFRGDQIQTRAERPPFSGEEQGRGPVLHEAGQGLLQGFQARTVQGVAPPSDQHEADQGGLGVDSENVHGIGSGVEGNP